MKRRMLLMVAIACFLAGSCAALASGGAEPIDEKNADYQTLLHAEFFAYGGVGYSGDLPNEMKALWRLYKEPNARDYFVRLEQEANNEGKLYALCGIYHTDFKLYQVLMENYIQNEEWVKRQDGCIFSEEMIKESILFEGKHLTEKERNRIVRLKDHQESLDEWFKQNDAYESFYVDFYGGAVPHLMMKGMPGFGDFE